MAPTFIVNDAECLANIIIMNDWGTGVLSVGRSGLLPAT